MAPRAAKLNRLVSPTGDTVRNSPPEPLEDAHNAASNLEKRVMRTLVVLFALLWSAGLLPAQTRRNYFREDGVGVIPAVAYEVELDIMEVTGMAVDAAGSVYLSGYNWSTGGSRQPQVLRKLDAAGTSVYTVQLGDLTYTNPLLPPTGIQISGVAVDKAGSVYITGFVNQAGLHTVNAAQPFPRGQGDAFVAKLWPDGSGPVYFTYLGGTGRDEGRKIAVDADGNAYVTGSTCSTDFPTVNAAQPSFSGGDFRCEGFVTKLGPTGSSLVYSTYLGGSNDDYGVAIASDDAGNAYVSGVTASPDFPTTKPSQAQMTCNLIYLCRDAFVTKLDASGAIVYSTFLGGSSWEQA